MEWAAILAGGSGKRLQPLTQALTGDDRPKQFCPLLDGQTLLARTRARIALNVPAERTVCVVTRAHELYYRKELGDLSSRQLIEQPRNCGTAAAIGYTVARVAREDRQAVLGFYPADHHYDDVETLRSTIEATYRTAQLYPRMVFLLGTEPDSPEVEYGWIEAGRPIQAPDGRVFAVDKFWEKPSRPVAEQLFTRGCLWNMFIMIGHVQAFRALLDRAVPDVTESFELVEQYPAREAQIVDSIYESLIPVDFSHDVLAWHPDRVGVVQLPSVGWTDLGQMARVRAFLTMRGAPPPSLEIAS